MPGDYDGSGKTDVAAYLPTLGVFAYRSDTGGGDVTEASGVPYQSLPVTDAVQPRVSILVTVMAPAVEAAGVVGEPDAADFVPDLARKKDDGRSA